MKILLIEDNPADASLIMDLCKIGFGSAVIEWASSLADGISQLDVDQYNLIILDLGLPDSDGLDTLYSFKPHTICPIVVLTGHQSEELGVLAVKGGAQDYLLKGVDAKTLCRSLKYAIGRHSRSSIKKTKEQFTRGITHLTSIVDSLTGPFKLDN